MSLRIEFSAVDLDHTDPREGDLDEGERLLNCLAEALARGERAEVEAVARVILDVSEPGDEARCRNLLHGINFALAKQKLGYKEIGDVDIGGFIDFLIGRNAEGPVPINPEIVRLATDFLGTNDAETREQILHAARARLVPEPLVHEPCNCPDQATLKDFIALATVLVHRKHVVELEPDYWADYAQASGFYVEAFLDGSLDEHELVVAHPAALGPALHIRLAIGLMVNANIPVPPDWLVAWRLGLVHRAQWVPSQRLNACYRHLFAIRLARAHPDGVRMTAPKSGPSIRQQWVIGEKMYSIRFPDVREVAIVSPGHGGPLEFEALESLFRGCASDLSPLSKLLGKKPQARGTPEALALLPAELAEPKRHRE